MRRDGLLILDFLSPESLSIARKVRGERVYCTVLPCTAPLSAILKQKPLGIILAGGAEDAYEPGAADCDPAIYEMDIPLLGVGNGARLLAKHLGAKRLSADVEPHSARVTLEPSPLFSGLGGLERYFLRLDELDLPETLTPIARDDGGRVVAFADGARSRYGMQFTAEQNDPDGLAILRNFACGICGCEQWWSMGAFIEKAVDDIRAAVGEGSALMAVSGGVDSAVCAALMYRAIGARMHCVHIDTGLMRKDETRLVAQWFRESMGIELQYVDAAERFLARLTDVVEPEEKRRAIGDEFVRVFEGVARELGAVDCLVQGTTYSDVVAGSRFKGTFARTYHNVGGMPETMEFQKLVEPVRDLFKDEVRDVGLALGLPEALVHRQPFPGPGLAVRILGGVTREKLVLLREADAIFQEEILAAGLDKRIWQYFAVLTDVKTSGVRNETPCLEYALALRAVTNVSPSVSKAYRLPYDLLERVTQRVTEEVPGVNRVVYDLTGKPPATIEWE